MVTKKEAQALRECAKSRVGPLSVFLPEPQYRIDLGHEDGSAFRLVVKQGENLRSEHSALNRYKMGLWEQVFFRRTPRCRLCTKQIEDGQRALCFAFNPNGDSDTFRSNWRKGYIHAEECS